MSAAFLRVSLCPAFAVLGLAAPLHDYGLVYDLRRRRGGLLRLRLLRLRLAVAVHVAADRRSGGAADACADHRTLGAADFLSDRGTGAAAHRTADDRAGAPL